MIWQAPICAVNLTSRDLRNLSINLVWCVKADAYLITYHGITMRSADVKLSPTFGVYIELDIKRLDSN
jgi:hypothetical protein